MVKPICVIVTGLPYSGKSILAGITHYLGVDMGEYELGPEIYNFTDGFEDNALTNLNAHITKTHHNHSMLSVSSSFRERKFSYESHIERLLAIVSGRKNNAWGHQDTRFLIPDLLDEFIDVFRDRYDIKILLSYRNYLHCARHYKEWSEDNLCVENAMKAYSHRCRFVDRKYADETLIISYGFCFRNPIKVVRTIASFLNIPVTQDAFAFTSARTAKNISEVSDKIPRMPDMVI